MTHLRQHAPISRATLAEMTGLNKTTVSSLVRELIQNHFVREVGYDTSGIGRPAMLLDLNPDAGYIISAEIGVDFIAVSRTNFLSEVQWHTVERVRRSMSQRTTLEHLLALIERAIKAEPNANGGMLGLALGVPGLVDQKTGSLLFAPNLGWHDAPLADFLREHFDGPIFIDNEANMAALGEHYSGAAQGCDEVLYISAGVGLGGGIVRNGALFRGTSGFAGEFGHMTIIPGGPLCNCGSRGCWETVVSQAALYRSIREAVEAGECSVLQEIAGSDLSHLTIEQIVDAAKKGDAVTLEALDTLARYLSIGIASLVNAFDPELVVFGGILSQAADFLLPAVEDRLRERSLSGNTTHTHVVRARHGVNACIMGGVATVVTGILAQPGKLSGNQVP